MGTVIDFCARPHVGLSALGSDDILDWWYEWKLPEDTRKGDTAVLFAGGRRSCYVGLESIDSNWKRYRTGPLAGELYADADWTLFDVPVPAAVVDEALGLTAPKEPTRLDDDAGAELIAYLRRYQRTRTGEVEAIEGILTESRRRSRSRSPKLRAEKLRRSRGTCEACGTKFRVVAGIDGRRVLTIHHRRQISAYDEPRTTTLDHLAVVCANCHMLIHADPRRALPVEDLAAKLKKAPWGR
ncbi:MAG: HNH endonuclease [Actinomycetota bacterium]|nr:HNH endonuclease [Actinomycetota bacterium]